MACLSSRFPYGTPVTSEGLKSVDQAELFLRDECDFAQLRARHHQTLSRIELPAADLTRLIGDPDLRRRLIRRFAEIGYLQTTADLRGFRSGSMNEVLIKIDVDDAPLFERIDPILEAHALFPAAYEQRDQTLILRLPDPKIAQLISAELRATLVAALEGLGLRYIALDLDPLRV
jgi:hypothetical protein